MTKTYCALTVKVQSRKPVLLQILMLMIISGQILIAGKITHLYIPIIVNQQVWRFQIPMNNCRYTSVQAIHAFGLKKKVIFMSRNKETNKSTKYTRFILTTSRAILILRFSSIRQLGRWRILYKLPLNKDKIMNQQWITKYIFRFFVWIFFFLKCAGELRIIILRGKKGPKLTKVQCPMGKYKTRPDWKP
jgi:hypothetical protein